MKIMLRCDIEGVTGAEDLELSWNGLHGQVLAVSERIVRAAVRVAAPGGRFMLSSSNSIHAGVNPANFGALIAVGQRYGGYA